MPANFASMRTFCLAFRGAALGAVLHCVSAAAGQYVSGLSGPDAEFATARATFERGSYSAALHLLETGIADGDWSAEQRAWAEIHAALSALYLYHPDGASRCERAALQHPGAAGELRWETGRWFHREKRWKEAVAVLERVQLRDVDRSVLQEFRFRLGHALFECERNADALPHLEAAVDLTGEYTHAARYYVGHIHYAAGRKEAALSAFRSLEKVPEFKSLVPVYIAQLLHGTGRYDDLIDFVPVLQDSTIEMKPQLERAVARLVGDAFFRDQRFADAAPWLETAWKGSSSEERSRELAYQVGYARYMTGDLAGAVSVWGTVARGDDALAQNTHYHLADCYLKLGEKDRARTAFRLASEMSHDAEVREDALFQHAKLAYELSYNPFDDAITAIERYLKEYPDSRRRQEVLGFLIDVYMASKDYRRALEALEALPEKNAKVRKAFQEVAYNRAVELYRAGRFSEADPLFTSVRTYPVDPQLAAESHFWQGECAFSSRRYADAGKHYGLFLNTPGAFASPLYDDAEYARGYALYKQKAYSEALTAFRSFQKVDAGDQPKRTLDAVLRTADCFYATKDFSRAASGYAKFLESGGTPGDYARYQYAGSLGLGGNLAGQVDALKRMVADHPKSTLVPDARCEAARALIELNRLAEAEEQLDAVLTGHPNSPRTKNALVDRCLVATKQGKDDEALLFWDRIRTEFGNDPIAADAFNVVENILIERGLLDNLPSGVGLGKDEIEGRLFAAAQALASGDGCEKAVLRLGEYIRQYPSGVHAVEAHFLLGDCLSALKRPAEARAAYETVCAAPTNEFTEPAAKAAATLAWNAEDVAGALTHYRRLEQVAVLSENVLEARIGLMRCHYLLNEPEPARAYADLVLADGRTPEDIRRVALFWRGKLRFDAQDVDGATQDLKAVSAFGGARGAEAQYLLARMAYDRAAWTETEDLLFALIDGFSSYDVWKNKGFLLLARTYLAQKDYFQARTTAESILKYVTDPAVLAEARALLAEIDAAERGPEPTPDAE
jgi:TolA-binding protein